MTKQYLDDLSYQIIGCAMEVHKILGPGLLESLYEKCFIEELALRDIKFCTQKFIEVSYKNKPLDAQLRYDVLVEDLIVVELKSVEALTPIFHAVLLTYMKLLEKPKGILINFNCTNIFKEGQKTLVNEFYAKLP